MPSAYLSRIVVLGALLLSALFAGCQPPVVRTPGAQLSASATTLIRGQSADLSWTVTAATGATDARATLRAGNGTAQTVALSGSLTVTPTETTLYTLTADNLYQGQRYTTQKTLSLTVTIPPPAISEFSLSSNLVAPGESVVIRWQTQDADSAQLFANDAVIAAGTSGETSISVQTNTIIRIDATNAQGTTSQSANIEINGTLISTITFFDMALANCINAAAAEQQAIYAEQLLRLDCTNQNIAQINGLEYFHQLQHLDLTANRIADIYPLSGLKMLTSLQLADNNIRYVGDMRNLSAVQDFDLSRNPLTDVGQLREFLGKGDFTRLALADLPLSNADFLDNSGNWSQLHTLILAGTHIENLPLNNNYAALQELDVSNTPIQELPYPASESVRRLNIANTRIRVLGSLPWRHDLEAIDISNTPLHNFSYDLANLLQHNRQLLALNISGHSFEENLLIQNPLPETLELLGVANTGVQTLDFTTQLANLKTLDASGNHLQDIWPLASLPQLQQIRVSNNTLYSLSALHDKTGLLALDVSNNPLQNELATIKSIINNNPQLTVLGLSGLPVGADDPSLASWLNYEATNSLQTLLLENAGLTNAAIQRLSMLQNIVSLDISNNALIDLPAVCGPHLNSLDVSDNRILTWPWQGGCSALQRLNISNNHILESGSGYYGFTAFVRQREQINAKPWIELRFAGLDIDNLDFLGNIEQLQILDASRTGISDISALDSALNLRQLYLANNAVDNAWPLDALHNLVVLDISNTRMNLYGTASAHLRELNVSHTPTDSSRLRYMLRQLTELLSLSMAGIDADEYFLQELSQHTNADSMQKLDLSDTGIRSDDFLEEFRHLRELNLAQNYLVEFNTDLPMLQQLDLSSNELQFAAVQGMQLTSLDLSDNPLPVSNYDIQSIIGANPSLKKIGLSYLPIDGEALLSWLSVQPGRDQIQSLRLANTGIDAIPYRVLEQFDALTELDLDDNNLQYLDANLCELGQLRVLRLAGNQLTQFAIGSWDQCPSLSVLDLSHNPVSPYDIATFLGQITTPMTGLGLAGIDLDSFGFLTNYTMRSLQELNIADTGFDNVYMLTELKQLQTLDISGNPLQQLPALQQMPLLRNLAISNTQIGYIDPLSEITNQFESLKIAHLPTWDFDQSFRRILNHQFRLRELDIAGNVLQAGTYYNFDTARLRFLSVAATGIDNIDFIDSLAFLRELNASDNAIDQLPWSMPQWVRNLNLANNALTSVYTLMIEEHVQHLRMLDLTGNDGIWCDELDLLRDSLPATTRFVAPESCI